MPCAWMLTGNSPAAGGMLTGKVTRETTNESGSRWSSEHVAGQMYSASELVLYFTCTGLSDLFLQGRDIDQRVRIMKNFIAHLLINGLVLTFHNRLPPRPNHGGLTKDPRCGEETWHDRARSQFEMGCVPFGSVTRARRCCYHRRQQGQPAEREFGDL